MSNFSSDQDDQKLITFLKQNRPLPPSVKSDFEGNLMLKIKHSPQIKSSSSRHFFVYGAIAGLVLVWGGIDWFSSKYQTAKISSDQELEAFLLDGWYGTMGETSYRNAQSDFETQLNFVSQ
jgi:hypothetical protein